jgi:hypothetical protein
MNVITQVLLADDFEPIVKIVFKIMYKVYIKMQITALLF